MSLAATVKELAESSEFFSSFKDSEEVEESLRESKPGADPRLSRLSGDERSRKIYEYKMRGMRAADIAVLFGLSERQIYNILNSYFHKAAQELASKPPISAVVEHLEFCENIARVALFEANNIHGTIKRIDPTTGKVVVVSQQEGEIKDKNLLLKTALAAQESKMNILIKAGVIPNDSARQFSPIKPEDEKGEAYEMTIDELKRNVVELLKATRSI